MELCKNCQEKEATHDRLCYRCKWDDEDVRGRIKKNPPQHSFDEKRPAKSFGVRMQEDFARENRKKIRKQLGL